MSALEMIVSDHVPLLLNCTMRTSVKASPRIEIFWLKYREAHQIVQRVWDSARPSSDPRLFIGKIDKMHKEFKEWHLGRFSLMDTQLENYRKALMFFDSIEEHRTLDTGEFNFRLKIRARAYELAQNIELRWRQRSRVTWL